MFLHEYFVVVSIAAVMNAVDFLWGIVVGLVLACIIMVVNVSRCCARRRAACARNLAQHCSETPCGRSSVVRSIHSGLTMRSTIVRLFAHQVWCSQNTRALTHAQPHWCCADRKHRQLCTHSG